MIKRQIVASLKGIPGTDSLMFSLNDIEGETY